MNYVIFASYGNDSIALIQHCHDLKLKGVTVAYNDTGWSADWWKDRINKAEQWCKSFGFSTIRIESEGMENLVRRKNAWPRGGGGKFQFCTYELKEKPALKWLDENDPEKTVTCVVGIRREESMNRRTFPEWTTSSKKHGNRELWAPLVRLNEQQRNELLKKSPFQPLPHRSKECWPCVNARKSELKLLEEKRINRIDALEIEMGKNSKGNDIVMFSPARHNNSIGIRQVVYDAKKGIDDLFGNSGCDGGWCGS